MSDASPPLMICAGFDWGHPSPLRHLEIELSRSYRVLHLESIGMRRPVLDTRDLRRALWKGARWLSRRPHLSDRDDVEVIAPLVVPLHGAGVVRSLNASALCRRLVRVAGREALAPELFLTALPTAVDLLERLQPRTSAYYRVDEWPRWPGIDGDVVVPLERRLMDRVDVTVCTSTALLDGAWDRHGAPSLLPQGVDLAHFAAAMQPGEIHDTVAGLRGPVAGFFGLLDDRLDRDLLRGFCRSWPGSVVLAGHRHGRWDEAAGRVRYAGWLPYDELPSFARGVQVWVLPYRLGARTHAIDPLKLREYLATGLPVVSTPLTGVQPWREHVAIADGVEAFVQAALAAAADPLAGRAARLASLRGHAWSDRCETFHERLRTAGRVTRA
jgi:glycosyltransferase involved in cell wall biosynthesis